MPRIVETLASRLEISEIAYYLGMQRYRLADKFLSCVRDTYEALAVMPTLGTIVEELLDTQYAGARRFSVKRFSSYLIFYRPIENGIVILHVLDGHRDYLKSVFEIDPNQQNDLR